MTISSRGQQRDKQENAFLTNFIIAQSTVNAASTVQFLILIMSLKLNEYSKGNAKGHHWHPFALPFEANLEQQWVYSGCG